MRANRDLPHYSGQCCVRSRGKGIRTGTESVGTERRRNVTATASSRLAATTRHLGKKSCKPLLALLPSCSSWRDAVIFLFDRKALNKRLYPPACSTGERRCRARSRTVSQKLRRGDTVRAARQVAAAARAQGCPCRSALSESLVHLHRDGTGQGSSPAKRSLTVTPRSASRQARAPLTAAAPAAERPSGAAALLSPLLPLRSPSLAHPRRAARHRPRHSGLRGVPALGPPRCVAARPGGRRYATRRCGADGGAGPRADSSGRDWMGLGAQVS